MKQVKHLLLYTLCLSLSTSFAQVPANVSVNRSLVKVNLSGVLINSYMAQYERVLNQRSSITFSASYTPKNTLLLSRQLLKNQFGNSDDARQAIDGTQFGQFSANLEYRFYLASHAPTGWYIAPFLRYTSLDLSNDYTYTPNDGILHHTHLDASFSAGAVGVLLGYQFMLGKRLGVDLWLLGPFYGTNVNAKLVGVDPLWPNLKPADVTKLKNDIDNTKLPLYTVSSTINLPTITATVTGPYYGFRTLGVALAYSF